MSSSAVLARLLSFRLCFGLESALLSAVVGLDTVSDVGVVGFDESAEACAGGETRRSQYQSFAREGYGAPRFCRSMFNLTFVSSKGRHLKSFL